MSKRVGFERHWRFRARPESRDTFEALYGSEGAWAKLFSRHPGFRGTELQRVPDAPLEYLLIDRWESRRAWDAFRREHAAAYEELDRRCGALTSSEELVREVDLPAS
ncbi:MAG TPA: antibiotic biosynthesis monooxygenase family protein [Gemmatimonadaceae bacterium]|nr:antibiotic biosynthesis monooxygenase family protein [Gemmatimonadaceae bacterium]